MKKEIELGGGIEITPFDIEERTNFELKVAFWEGLRKQGRLRDCSTRASAIGGVTVLIFMQ